MQKSDFNQQGNYRRAAVIGVGALTATVVVGLAAMSRTAATPAGALTTLTPPAGRPGPVAAAEGKFTLGKGKTNLRHVVARVEPNAADARHPETHVYLSDVPLSTALLNDEKARKGMALVGKLHAVEFVIDDQNEVRYVALAAAARTLRMEGGGWEWTPKATSADVIAGRFVVRPNTFQEDPIGASATFTAPLGPKPTQLTGPAAQASAPAKAALAYRAACLTRKAAAIRRCVTPASAEIITDDPYGQDYVNSLASIVADVKDAPIVAVSMAPDRAVVTFEERVEDVPFVRSFVVRPLADGSWAVDITQDSGI